MPTHALTLSISLLPGGRTRMTTTSAPFAANSTANARAGIVRGADFHGDSPSTQMRDRP